jgi:hypothetical protein
MVAILDRAWTNQIQFRMGDYPTTIPLKLSRF